MINDYFILTPRPDQAANDLNFDMLAKHMRQYVIASRDRTGAKISEDDVAVVLCIDELRKIVVDDTRRELLNALAAFQQEELIAKRRSFVVVSSLDLWPLYEEWVTASKRRLTPLPLPPLPLGKLIENESSRRPRAEPNPPTDWDAYVHTRIGCTGGHPRMLEAAMRDIEKARENPGGSWDFTGMSRMESPDLAAFWRLCMRYIVIGRTCIKGIKGMQAQTEDGAHLRSFADSHFAMVEPMTTHNSDGEASLDLRLTPIPYAFVAAQVDRNDECGGVRGEWLHYLGYALYNPHSKITLKVWESGMLAAVALHALAHADDAGKSTADRDVGPCLSAVLPKDPAQCQFSSDAVTLWRIPIATLRAFEVTTDLWPARSEKLVRLSPNEKQPAVEGSLELVDDKGRRAVGWFQHKLHSKLAAKELAGVIREIKVYHDKNHRGTPMCAILFCTGNTKAALETKLADVIKNYPELKGVNYVCIGTHGCAEMLKPFGASVLATTIVRRCRPTDGPKQ